MIINKLFNGFIGWVDSFFDDTSEKLIKICRMLSKVLSWAHIVLGWLSVPAIFILMLIAKDASFLLILFLGVILGYLNATLTSVFFAFSVSFITALADIADIHTVLCGDRTKTTKEKREAARALREEAKRKRLEEEKQKAIEKEIKTEIEEEINDVTEEVVKDLSDDVLPANADTGIEIQVRENENKRPDNPSHNNSNNHKKKKKKR